MTENKSPLNNKGKKQNKHIVSDETILNHIIHPLQLSVSLVTKQCHCVSACAPYGHKAPFPQSQPPYCLVMFSTRFLS